MNINVTVNTSFTAILVVNIKDVSKMINVKVQINSHNCAIYKHPIEINGFKVLIYLYDKISDSGSLMVDNFYYSNYKTCEHHLLCVIVTMLLQNHRLDAQNKFWLYILNSAFSNSKNSSILCSYGETMEGYTHKIMQRSYRYIIIKNSIRTMHHVNNCIAATSPSQ